MCVNFEKSFITSFKSKWPRCNNDTNKIYSFITSVKFKKAFKTARWSTSYHKTITGVLGLGVLTRPCELFYNIANLFFMVAQRTSHENAANYPNRKVRPTQQFLLNLPMRWTVDLEPWRMAENQALHWGVDDLCTINICEQTTIDCLTAWRKNCEATLKKGTITDMLNCTFLCEEYLTCLRHIG